MTTCAIEPGGTAAPAGPAPRPEGPEEPAGPRDPAGPEGRPEGRSDGSAPDAAGAGESPAPETGAVAAEGSRTAPGPPAVDGDAEAEADGQAGPEGEGGPVAPGAGIEGAAVPAAVPAPPPLPPVPAPGPEFTGFALAADGSYAARLAGEGEARYPERWTLDGPEPYAVPLPMEQPEEADSELLALADGRVLIHRRVAGRHLFALLYPSGAAGGPRTGELALGGIEAAGLSRVRLLPPAPDGRSSYALAVGRDSTEIWCLTGEAAADGPRRLTAVPGDCAGGIWLDRAGRTLALDRTDRQGDGRTRTVAVDLAGEAETAPLLQIGEDSEDRLLLADPDSGLLLIRSDAPGEPRLGWGVLGSPRPVRFPECLRPVGADAVPFAVQPGQVLMPEGCAVAMRLGDGGVGLWRPVDKHLFRLGAPAGWLGGTGLWTREGVLRLPYALPGAACGVVRLTVPQVPPEVRVAAVAAATRPVPLQQAPLAGR
ncbi:hypothetical protein [Streptomyces sp. NPDC097619]|uniref:hypothetical protein n=1 Tax=Streptomyces sp. NPDC097619 TaxID=3157228 RepID=UPI00331B72C9